MRQLRGKVAAITGAASGIGRALAVELAERGCSLALADVDEVGLGRVPVSRCSLHRVDVSDAAAVERYAREALAHHGAVDLLVNNAGVVNRGSIEGLSYTEFREVLDTNLWGVIHGTKAFLPALRSRPEARLVNVASFNALLPFPRNGPYNLAKSAVASFSETLRQELRGTTVRVTCVYPGGVRTNLLRNSSYFDEAQADDFDRIATLTPERAARRIVAAIRRDRFRSLVGIDAWLGDLAKRIAPSASVRIMGIWSDRQERGSPAWAQGPAPGRSRQAAARSSEIR